MFILGSCDTNLILHAEIQENTFYQGIIPHRDISIQLVSQSYFTIEENNFQQFLKIKKAKRKVPLCLLNLFHFKRACIKPVIGSFFLDKLFMTAALDYSAVVKHHNNVGILNG